jgi:hypothetical protein
MLIPHMHRLTAIFVFLAKLNHTSLESPVRNPGVEDVLRIVEHVEL